jgi:hypothetical protein
MSLLGIGLKCSIAACLFEIIALGVSIVVSVRTRWVYTPFVQVPIVCALASPLPPQIIARLASPILEIYPLPGQSVQITSSLDKMSSDV